MLVQEVQELKPENPVRSDCSAADLTRTDAGYRPDESDDADRTLTRPGPVGSRKSSPNDSGFNGDVVAEDTYVATWKDFACVVFVIDAYARIFLAMARGMRTVLESIPQMRAMGWQAGLARKTASIRRSNRPTLNSSAITA